MIAATILFLAQTIGAANSSVGSLRGQNFSWPTTSIDLPNTVYALEGLTNTISFQNVIRFDADWALLTVSVNCAKGSSAASSWTYVPSAADAGTNTLTFTVSSGGNVLASKTCSLVTRPLAYPLSPVSRKLLLIGDSTSAGGTVSAQLINLFNGDADYALTEVGSNNGNATDSGGTSRAVSFDAISGWTLKWFNTNAVTAWTELGGTARTGSPFVFSGSFNFATYLATNSISLAAGDWVIFNLGINDVFTATSDSALASATLTATNALVAMVTGIKGSVPGIRVAAALTIPPTTSVNLFAKDYGAGQTLPRYQRNNHLFVESLLSLEGIDGFIPINGNIDCSADFASGVHPNSTGYYKIADTYRAFLKGIE